MEQSDTHTIEAMPWYRSTIIVSALISLVTKALVVTGVISEISSEDTTALANAAVLILGGVADLVAVKSRVMQKQTPTIVSTTKKATAINALPPAENPSIEHLPEAQEVLKDIREL